MSRRWLRRPTHADGSWSIGRGWWKVGLHVAYYLNTTNLDGSRFYTVQFWLGRFEAALHFRGIHWPEIGYFETFDKRTGRVGDLREDNPELAKVMEPYRHERDIEWRLTGPIPRKLRSLTVKHSWKLDL